MEKEEGEDSDDSTDATLFVVDTEPKVETDAFVPRYKSKFQVLSDTVEEDHSSKKRRQASLQNCFNCGSTEHALRECPEPRDFRAISKNRQIFINSKPSLNNGFNFQRYHVDEAQKYAHFKPGSISKALRGALGITSYQLPPYIYKMRQLGYPLGWLEEIKVSHSGLSMFDGNGQEITELENEEGEVFNPGDRDKYDTKKIISYPGYNVPPSSKVTDEHEKYQAPPFNPSQSKEMFVQVLKQQGNYQTKPVVKKMKENIIDDVQIIDDMEVEDTPEVGLLPEDHCGFVPPLPDKAPPPPPPDDNPPCLDESSADNSNGDCNLSLQDLESKKNELLAELNDTTCVHTPPNKNLGKIKTVELGTPVLKSVSPYSKLPSADRFSVDICDVINFENLPDSTGKYEKMSVVIRKVRTKVSKLQAEKS